MSERLAQALCLSTIDRLLQGTKVTEVLGEDGGPFRTLELAPQPEGSPLTADGPLGSYRIWTSEGSVAKVVYAGVSVPVLNMDTHMIYAFSDPETAIPHFTLDSVEAHGTLAFHLDLNPRADLGAHLAYMDYVYGPLTDVFESGKAIEGLSEARLTPRQRAIMSPWMLVSRATPDAYRQLGARANAYLDRWFTLSEQGLPDWVMASLADTNLPARDAANRSMIFSRDVDPVWDQITPLLGFDVTEIMRINLEFNKITSEV